MLTGLGKNCGGVSDGCGGTLNCGPCTPPQTCGGGGTSNVCGCTPKTCAPGQCGVVPNGCGGPLNCGACAAPQTCGGGGALNVCGCKPTTCQLAGYDCGTAPDGSAVEIFACLIVAIDNGKITRIDEYLDTAQAAALMRR